MFRLGDDLRSVFQKPFGPVLQTDEFPKQVSPSDSLICIGDRVSCTALELGFHPKLIVVDFRTKRGPVDPELKSFLTQYGKTVIRVVNEPATVSNELYVAVVQALRLAGGVRIEVEGEEDLAGLPVFAEAPLGSVVVYGMPDRGMVVVRVDEAMRQRARELLDRMRVP